MIQTHEIRALAEKVGLLWNGTWQVDEAKFMKAVEAAYQQGHNDANTKGKRK